MKSSIGDVASLFGLDTHVLRHWEDVGLLSPERDSAGRRRYAEGDLVRIAVVLRSKAAGMGLEQIAVLLDAGAEGRHDVLAEHLAELDRRMAAMAWSRAMTLHALECSAHDVTSCPRFQAALTGVLEGRPWQDATQSSSSSPPLHVKE